MIVSNKEWGGLILDPGCGNFCVFCGQKKVLKRSRERLRQQEINVAKNLVDFKKRGLRKISISGSDPIEYDKIIPLIKYIKKMGFEFVRLSTHGKRLSDESFLNQLVLSGIDELRIPLYGSNAKVHDLATRTEVSFEATFKGIKKVLERAPNIQVRISSLILQQNKNDLTNLVELVKELKVKYFYFSIPCLANKDYSYYVPLRNLKPYVKKVYDYALKINFKVHFMEIPYCVFDQIDKSVIHNKTHPPDLGECQPPKIFRTSIKDLPSYRIKKKFNMCKTCKALNFCDGFFVNDIDKFGTGNLKPIN